MDMLQSIPLTLNLGKPGLTNGTTTTYTIGTAFNYAIAGRTYNKGTASNAATPTTDVNTSAAFPGFTANNGTVVLWMVDASQNVKCAQGQIQALDVSGNFITAPQFPAVPDGYCPFAYLVLKGGSTLSGTFTFGSSNLSGVTGMTYTFQDIMGLPARPQVA